MEQFKPEEEREITENEYLNPNSLTNKARKTLAVLGALAFSFGAVKAEEPKSEKDSETKVEMKVPDNEAGHAFEKIGGHKISPIETGIIGDIKTYNPGDFEKTIFVIRQRHSLRTDSSVYQNWSKEKKALELQTVSQTQKQIGVIVDWIHEKTQTKNVVFEGIFPEDIPFIKDAWKDEATTEQTNLRLYGGQIDDIYQTGLTIPKHYLYMYKTYRTESLLLNRDWIKPLPGDVIETDQKKLARQKEIDEKYGSDVTPGSKGIPENIQEYLEKTVCTDRENHVLDLVRNQNEPTTIVIYGAAHDFEPEVEASNKKHPDHKIGLVVITPELVKSFKE